MKAIYKYPLPIQEKVTIELPQGARIIRIEDVDGLFFLWAIVDTGEDVEKETRRFELYKTGQPIETPLVYLNHIGTCKIFIGQELCLYVFESFYPEEQ